MPDFLGIGAQKAGTTWLHAGLACHPRVFLAPEKEVHFWDRRRDLGLGWYKARFAAAPPGAVTGEITPAYAILPDTVVAEVAAAFPALKLFFCLRNPIERAWSSALMALGRAEMTLEDASDQWFVDHFRSAGSLARGDYEACLRRWLGHYPAERLHLVAFERIAAEPLEVLAGCARHLGLDCAPLRLLPPDLFRQRMNAGPPWPLPDRLRAVLEEIYRPRIDSLGRFLGADLACWR